MTDTVIKPELLAALRGPLTLRPIANEGEVRAISQAARVEGNHFAIRPTHIVERGGQVVGYMSLNAIPVLTGWLSDKEVSQDEGKQLIAQIEDEARAQGLDFVCLPMTTECRFRPDMRTMGYRTTGNQLKLHFKNL